MSTFRASRTAAVAVTFALLLLGCGGDDTGQSDQAQPSTDATVFVDGEFGDIPLHPRSSPLQEPHRENDSVSQSFSVTGATPEQIVSFYERALQTRGWEKLSKGPLETGDDTARAEWSNGDSQLKVSATAAPTLEEEGNEAASQYSLVLTGF